MSSDKTGRKDPVRYLILLYWALFWLLNSIDKIIGGSHFLFVGKDRFASIERFFDSIGLPDPIYANVALIITAALEIFAFVFFAGALYHLSKKNQPAATSWFFIGIVLTLTIFTYFSIGDQVFGDHGELLEHAIYWFIALLTWVIFMRAEKVWFLDNMPADKRQLQIAVGLWGVIFLVAAWSIFHHNQTSFIERTRAVAAVQVDSNLYRISFPFLAGSTAFENSIAGFKREHPSLKIDHVYTVPHALRLGKSDGLIIYLKTEPQ